MNIEKCWRVEALLSTPQVMQRTTDTPADPVKARKSLEIYQSASKATKQRCLEIAGEHGSAVADFMLGTQLWDANEKQCLGYKDDWSGKGVSDVQKLTAAQRNTTETKLMVRAVQHLRRALLSE
jgi:hypothetical protein